MARIGCLLIAFLLVLIGGTSRLPAHSLLGTETWVHIARPGIELRITFFSERLAEVAELSLSRDKSASDRTLEIWMVESDGSPCKADTASVRSERSNGHLTIKLRFPCATVRKEVVLTPQFTRAIGRSRTNVLRVLAGDHLAEFQLRPVMRPIIIPVGNLMADRDVILSDEFLGGWD